MVGAPHQLVVRQHQRRIDGAAHGQRLAQRVVDGIALVADVHGDEAGAVAQRLGHGDQLVGGGGACRRVVHAGGQADGAVGQRVGQPRAHGVGLGRRGGTVQVGHAADAQRGVAHQRGGIHRRPGRLHRGQVVTKARKAEGIGAHQVQRRRRRVGHQRRQADAAVAGDHRRHALHQLGVCRRVLQQQRVVVRVGVDEAGRDDQAAGVDVAAGGLACQRAHGGDGVAADGHVGRPARGAAAVDDGAALDQEVEHGGTSSGWGAT